jgi:outer membrane receptor protein involved in Fe transport
MNQYAVFGEVNWALNERLKLTTGLRWYKFDTDVDEESSGIATASGNATPTLSNFKASSTGFNPKVTLSYETEDRKLTAYTTAARGFRPGGVNQQIPTGIGCNLTAETYGPDNTWNYEVGEKAKLADNRVTVNADYYYIRWGDVQQLLNQGCGYPLTQNAGVAAAYGPEIEISARLTDHWSASLSGAHTHSALKSVNPELTAANSAFVPGLPILNIPDNTASASLTYSTPISDNFRLTARASGSYVGSSTDISYTYGTLEPYSLYGLRIGLASERYTVSLFADNITNKHAQLGINTTSFDWVIPSLTRVATNTPRTIGVDLRVQF